MRRVLILASLLMLVGVAALLLWPPRVARAQNSSGGYGNPWLACRSEGGSAVTLSSTAGTYTTVASCQVAASYLVNTGACVRATVELYESASPAVATWRWAFGATSTTASTLNNSSSTPAKFEATVCETGTNAQQLSQLPGVMGNSLANGAGPVSPAETTTGTGLITIALQASCASACATPPQITPLTVWVEAY